MDLTMETVYMFSAVIGGAVLLLQMIMLVFGADADAGMDADAEIELDADDGALGLLSIRTIASFLAFFGLTGWYGVTANWSPAFAGFAAFAAGTSMMFLVAWLMSQLRKLYSQGNLDPNNAVGKFATVYLKIPAERAGFGKITVSIQGRSVQFSAQTTGPELPTGSQVRVVRRTTDNSFDVSAIEN